MLSPKLSINAIAVLASVVLSACTDSAAIENKSQGRLTVETQKVQQSSKYTVVREYVGTVQANQRANLGFELSGKVAQINVDVGEQVSKGEALITLDTQLLMTEKKQLEAQLTEIRAQLNLTQTNLKRQHALRKKGFSSEAEIDALSSQKEALIANVLQIQSSIAANLLRQQKSVITAPYPGIVGNRFVSLGDVVSAGAPTLELLSSGNKEAVIGIYKGDIKDVLAQGNYTIRVEDKWFNAELISLPSNINTNSRNVRMRFNLEGGVDVLDGELAYLSFEREFSENGFWLPNSALTDGLRGTWNIYVLNSNNNVKTVESRSVQVLYSDNSRVYVKGALSANDEVIISGLHKVVPGQIVQVSF